jgi:diaminopimelate epimerase
VNRVPFVKLQGAGNDFVLVDASRPDSAHGNIATWQAVAKQVCDRHAGVGADGVLLLLPADDADVRMIVINADGSLAEMCGNGIRCVARYWEDAGRLTGRALHVETGAGVLRPEMMADGQVRVSMGRPRLARHDIPMTGPDADRILDEHLEGTALKVTAVSMGNPHAVVFVPDLDEFHFGLLGPVLSGHKRFPEGVNAGFVQLLSPGEIRLRVWERGSGPTLACGTGACAAVVAGNLTGRLERDVRVHLPGGTLRVEWPSEDGDVYMTGPARHVFTGEIALAPQGADVLQPAT